MLKEKLREKERQLTEISNNSSALMTNSWHQAMSEAKRQYEAIDGALEVKAQICFSKIQVTQNFLSIQDVAQHPKHRQRLSGTGADAT